MAAVDDECLYKVILGEINQLWLVQFTSPRPQLQFENTYLETEIQSKESLNSFLGEILWPA